MSQIVIVGNSIEGLKISGTSRNPISYKGIIVEKGKKLHKFLSSFNTKARISEVLSSSDNKIVKAASISSDDEIICDDAIVRSVGNRFSNNPGSNISSTHGASVWSFTKQTNVMITKSHKEIENAILKRARLTDN